MATDTLSAVLQGLNNGVGTGIDLYKTMRAEERAKRQEAYTLSRDAIMDTRYENDQSYQQQQDTLAQSNWQKTFDAGREDARLSREAEERRHQQTMALTLQRMKAANQRASLKAGLEDRKLVRKDLESTFDADFASGLQMINSSASHHAEAVSAARNMGFNIPDDVVGKLRVMPRDDGTVMFAVEGDGDKFEPFDPDGEGGQSALVMPGKTFASILGGKNAGAAVDAFYARAGAAAEAEGRAQSLEAQVPSLRAQASAAKEKLRQAQLREEVELYGPRAEYLRQIGEARANADTDFTGETRTWVNPATGKTVVEQGGASSDPATLRAIREAEAAQAAGAQSVAGITSGPQVELATLNSEIARVPGRADSLRNSWRDVDAAVAARPRGEQPLAYRNAAATFSQNPTLASLRPGESPADANVGMREARAGLVKEITGKLNTVTGLSEKGKEKHNRDVSDIQAVLMSMPDELLATYLDGSGQATGTMMTAAQQALKMGKPAAIPYLMAATRVNLPPEAGVKLMQDPALLKIKDSGQRFEIASAAFDLYNTGKANSPEAGLGMVLGGVQ